MLITKASVGQRIDNFLMTQLKGVPKTRIYRALRKGEVRVNKGRVQASYRLQLGDDVRVPPIRMAERPLLPEVSKMLKRDLQSAILFETKDLMIVNKPPGLPVHGGSGVRLGLIEAFRQIYPQYENLYLIHRLDRDTSGCLLLAKHRDAMVRLQQLFRTREVNKEYLLLVHGCWPKAVSRVSKPLLKVEKGGERVVVVDERGKPAETAFEVVQSFSSTTLLRATLLTGRMHQIRVHASHQGYPIVGDRKYGDAQIDTKFFKKNIEKRLFLHAERLSFAYPEADSRTICVTAPGFHIDDQITQAD